MPNNVNVGLGLTDEGCCNRVAMGVTGSIDCCASCPVDEGIGWLNQLPPGGLPRDSRLRSGIAESAEAKGEEPWLKTTCELGETSRELVECKPLVDLTEEACYRKVSNLTCAKARLDTHRKSLPCETLALRERGM